MSEPGWIRMRKRLITDPAVLVMASKLKTTKAEVLGGLFLLWSLADDHGETLPKGVTKALLDEQIGVPGFCNALPCNWLVTLDGALHMPEYTKVNQNTARRRMLTAKRVAKHRAKQREPDGNAVTPLDQTRPDQTRVDKSKTNLPTTKDAKALAAYFAEVVGVNPTAAEAGKLLVDFGLGSAVKAAEHLASRKPSQRFDGVRNPAAFVRSLCKRAEAGDDLDQEANDFEPFDDWRARRDAELERATS